MTDKGMSNATLDQRFIRKNSQFAAVSHQVGKNTSALMMYVGYAPSVGPCYPSNRPTSNRLTSNR
jgi:hypothetical protein